MTVDARLLVSDAQAVTTTLIATDSIPLGVAGLDLGAGEAVGFQFNIDVAAVVSGTTETYAFQIVTATASNGTSGQVIIAERAFTTAQAAALTAGSSFVLPIPTGLISATATHITARYETANSAGVTVTAFLTPLSAANERNANIRSGFSVAS